MEEIKSRLYDVIVTVDRYLMDDLKNANSCETKSDLCSNLRSALSAARCVESDLVKLLKRAEKYK